MRPDAILTSIIGDFNKDSKARERTKDLILKDKARTKNWIFKAKDGTKD